MIQSKLIQKKLPEVNKVNQFVNEVMRDLEMEYKHKVWELEDEKGHLSHEMEDIQNRYSEMLEQKNVEIQRLKRKNQELRDLVRQRKYCNAEA